VNCTNVQLGQHNNVTYTMYEILGRKQAAWGTLEINYEDGHVGRNMSLGTLNV
jgi:hypothetical protein